MFGVFGRIHYVCKDPFADMHCAVTYMQGGRVSQKKSHKIGTSPPPLGAKSWQLTKKGWIGWECRILARWGRSGPTQPDSICQNFELVPDTGHTPNPFGCHACLFYKSWERMKVIAWSICKECQSVAWLVGWVVAWWDEFVRCVQIYHHGKTWAGLVDCQLVEWCKGTLSWSVGLLVCW